MGGQYHKYNYETDRMFGTIDLYKLANLLDYRTKNRLGGDNQRTAMLLGLNNKDNSISVEKTEENKSRFSYERYKFLLEAPFPVGSKCCSVMKKKPLHDFQSKLGLKPITAQMASESRLRTQKWLQNGCNGFNMKSPISNPMSFWTEQDVLWYIRINNLPICSVYGEILTDDEESGQMNIFDYEDVAEAGIFDLNRPLLHTTGCDRTGCMFCLYGAHLEKGEGRFERMKKTHPKQYNYIMKPKSEGGLGFKEVIDWTNEHGNLHIKY